MNQEMKPTPEQTEPSAEEVKTINTHLDALLGMDVRKPGSAAKLPAVIRITENLEAAGGKGFPVFPPSYAGEGTKAPPIYDLNGIEWGEALRVKGKDDNRRIIRYIKRARHCTMDSPQSHANRTEIAFLDDRELSGLVPQAEAKIPRKIELAGQSNANILTCRTASPIFAFALQIRNRLPQAPSKHSLKAMLYHFCASCQRASSSAFGTAAPRVISTNTPAFS